MKRVERNKRLKNVALKISIVCNNCNKPAILQQATSQILQQNTSDIITTNQIYKLQGNKPDITTNQQYYIKQSNKSDITTTSQQILQQATSQILQQNTKLNPNLELISQQFTNLDQWINTNLNQWLNTNLNQLKSLASLKITA
jgi:transcription termination factor NusB